MLARVVVVENYLYNVVVLEHMGIGIGAIDGVVVGQVASGEGSVQSWDFGPDVGYIVEERAGTANQLP